MILRKGNEPNILKLAVESLDVKSNATVVGGMMDSHIIITFTHYRIDELLSQLLDEYGEEEIYKKIKSLL